ncbi:hypothetical protein LEM8419_03325 [Neolewinella maritima]|uniref:Uncharacterized protein n=1 Tax=Neolewinella maritima TaxID=1383882 RepID=A0ABN8F667_9BACT|nr:hypothetical protein [Neolewinella maritima]CAH1002446.1 hypothetical protein LEM8419_03325 [Neolewinella maritima]
MFLEEEIEFPRKDDKLFIDDGPVIYKAWLHKSFQQFGTYATSYGYAAKYLIDSIVLREEQDGKDFLVYPIVFLIRHYVELRLKELIQGLNYCNSQNYGFPSHHRIDNMWGEFKRQYREIGEKDDDDEFKAMDQIIKELSGSDPISMHFRYPVDKAGNLTQIHDYICIKNLRSTFKRLSMLLDGLSDQIDHYKDITRSLMDDA